MPEVLLDRPPFRVEWIPGGPDLVIAFASVGHDPGRMPSPEFVRSASAGGRAALFVMDESRSWGTAEGFGAVVAEAVARVAAPGRRLAIGASMGGFAALKAAEAVELDAILAISPQFRPKADLRWSRWTDTLPEITAPLPEGPAITLLHGMQDDAAQALAFPGGKGVDHLVFADQSHSSLAPHLKARGLLEGLIAAALVGDRRRLMRMLGSAGGKRRQPLGR